MVPQVAQGGGIALSSGEEVLVDAQNLRAAGWLPLGELALEAAAEIALDGGGADTFSAAQAAAVDAIQVLLVDGLLECLATIAPALFGAYPFILQQRMKRASGTSPEPYA